MTHYEIRIHVLLHVDFSKVMTLIVLRGGGPGEGLNQLFRFNSASSQKEKPMELAVVR